MKNTMFLSLILLPIIFWAQTQRWTYQYNWQGSVYNGANYIVRGPDGNLYTAGYTYNNYTYLDILMLSLTSTGSERWVYHYDRNESNDQINALILGADNNLYAAGFTSYTLGDFAIIKMSLSDTVRWMYNYDGPANYADEANDVVYGADGNIYACGESGGIGTDMDFTVISLDTLGTLRWVYRFNGNANSEDIARSIIYGNDGNLYITGVTRDTANHSNLTVISLTTSGNQRWIYNYDGPTDMSGEGNAIIWGNDGNLYVAGKSFTLGNTYDFTVLSLTATGNQRWVYNTHGTDVWEDIANKLVYGNDGNIYAVGKLANVATDDDIYVVSFTPSGTVRWQYCPQDSGMDASTSICYGGDGNIYISERTDNFPSTRYDFTITSLTTTGSVRWTYNYDGPAHNDEAATSVIYGNDGYLYATGTTALSNNSSNYLVISLNPASGMQENKTSISLDRSSLTVYPNPAKTYFNIQLPQNADCSEIKIFDITGKQVKSEELKGKNCRVSLFGIQNGVYFVQVGDEVMKNKLIVNK